MQVSDTSSIESKPGSQDAKLPMHVLMLPPGSHVFSMDHRKPSNERSTHTLPKLQIGCDLIDQRWLHRERGNNGSSGTNVDISFYSSDESGGAIWIGASPLEIAMIDCCTCDERIDGEVHGQQWGSGKDMVMKSRTRLKRIREEEDDYLPSDEEDDRKCGAQVNDVVQNRPKCIRGSIKRGREAHFLSLMARFCNNLSDRSLALAILTRTVQADKDEEIIHKHREYLHQRWKQGLSSSDTTMDKKDSLPEDSVITKVTLDEHHSMDNNGLNEDKEESTPEITNDHASSVEYPSPGILPIPIITNFLTFGGMKVLNLWLQEAFTPTVSAAQSSTEATSTQRTKPSAPASTATNAKRRGSSATNDASKVSLIASRTVALLPVILKLLQDMPFHKALVYETQINKPIRKLKKLLDKAALKLQTNHNVTMKLEQMQDPVFGPLPVAQVLKAVESLMTTWKEAVTLSNKSAEPESRNEASVPDPFFVLRQRLRERFQTTYPNAILDITGPLLVPTKAKSSASVMENKNGKGSSLPSEKSAVNKIQTREEELKAMQARLDAQRKIMELHLQKMNEANNKMAEEASERKIDVFTNIRRVTWADNYKKGVLVDVREYVVDSFNHEESSHDFSSKREDHRDLERRRLLQNDRPTKMYIEDEDDDDDIFS